jgi:hypothetical protein
MFNDCYSQKKKFNPFQMVVVPDSIKIILENSYNGKTGQSVNAGKHVYNLINRSDFKFKDGIFSFQGQGPHFPRKIFIFNKGVLFIFKSDVTINPKGVIAEFLECVSKLKLDNIQVVDYLTALSEYVKNEFNNKYGSELIE